MGEGYMGKNQHVTPHPSGGWQVKGAGNTRAAKIWFSWFGKRYNIYNNQIQWATIW